MCESSFAGKVGQGPCLGVGNHGAFGIADGRILARPGAARVRPDLNPFPFPLTSGVVTKIRTWFPGTKVFMGYTFEQQKKAVELYIEYGKDVSAVCSKLGHSGVGGNLEMNISA